MSFASICITGPRGKPGEVYYALKKNEQPIPKPQKGEVLIRVLAAALNHRDLFIRQHLYMGTDFDVPLLADGVGIVISAGDDKDEQEWKGKRVLTNPGVGWKDESEGPEPDENFVIVGGTKLYKNGTLQEYMIFAVDDITPCPEYLNNAEAAALPLAGLTAYRALFDRSNNAEKGRNILVTGIGGGVALYLLQFGVGAGCNIYVSSGSAEKMEKAKKLGAAGAVNYKDDNWPEDLKSQLPKDRQFLDAVIDGNGQDIVPKLVKILRHGATVVSYGMTNGGDGVWPMAAVLKNIQLRGSTMGSRREFKEMVDFATEQKIKPIISRTIQGLDIGKLDSLWEDMKSGSQFGKLVVEIWDGKTASQSPSRL